MSKSPSVLVAVGANETPKLPRQNYEPRVHTIYNMPVAIGATTPEDHNFFNGVIQSDTIDGEVPNIYGFLKGNQSYSSPSSLQEIVGLFQLDPHVEIVTTDLLVKKISIDTEFIEYSHSEAINDCAFFVKSSLIDHVKFESNPEMFKGVLDSLVRQGKKIYHIAEPLLTAEFNE